MVTPGVDSPVDIMESQDHHEAEIRLMGLILAQSTLVGVAIGIFDAEVWLKQDSVWINGFTYAMGAFFMQGIAYYFFKMFFEQNLQEKVRHGNIEKQRNHQYRMMQQTFDNRRAEMEMRMQEAQLERELRWMEENPGKMPPSWGVAGGSPSMIGSFDNRGGGSTVFDSSRIPTHEAKIQQPLTLGIDEEPVKLKKDGTPDKRYEKKS
tara:strand:+ start:290 stop:910 length:621 start_codon:yes stop_codon:yes gene_type:complete